MNDLPTDLEAIVPSIAEVTQYNSIRVVCYKLSNKVAPRDLYRAKSGAIGKGEDIFFGNCFMKPVKTRAGETLGYYYLIKVDSPQQSPSIDPVREPLPPEDITEFDYSHQANAYFQRQRTNCSIGSNRAARLSGRGYGHTLSPQFKMDNIPQTDTPEYESIPLALQNALSAAIKIFNFTEDSTLLYLIKAKKSYSKGITTYRLLKPDIIQVQEEVMQIYMEQPKAETRITYKKCSKEAESIKYMKNTLKSKEYVEKILKALPLPKSFFWITAISIFAAILSCAIVILVFLIYVSLMINVENCLEIYYHVTNQYRIVSTGSNYIMQALGINE